MGAEGHELAMRTARGTQDIQQGESLTRSFSRLAGGGHSVSRPQIVDQDVVSYIMHLMAAAMLVPS